MRSLFLATAALLAAASSEAQTGKAAVQQPLPPVSERVEVSITNIEVVVTDSKGNRVAGLTKDDFEVLQDGVPQKITNLYAVSGGKVVLEDGKLVALDAPEAPAEAPRELKARYVIYVDNLTVQPQNRNRMFKRLKEFVLQTIGPGAEAMVVTYNRSLKVRRKFTSDANDIVGALEEIEHQTGAGTTMMGERRDNTQRINDTQSPDEAFQIARAYSQSLRNDVEFDAEAIRNTVNSLAGLDGRKVLVYVSEGLPETAGLELYDLIQRKFMSQGATMEQMEFNMTSRYAAIVQAANAQGVTIWALDTSGLAADEMISAENRSYKARPSDFLLRQNMQAPLQLIAEQTGGVAVVNTNDWKKDLEELAKDFSNFYSLGYRTTRSGVDRAHAIEVKVKRKGLKARFRKGLLEKTVETRTAESVLGSLFYPRDENPLGVSVSLGQQKPNKNNSFNIPVRIAIPIGKLGLTPSADSYEGSFIVYVVVRDAEEKQSDLAVLKQAVKVPTKDFAKAQQKDFYYDFTMTVGPGAQRISFAVRDGVSDLVSYYQKNVFVSLLPAESKEKKKAS
ncbi:MAG TPA: VWA domain-containing protein [Thermoanaerobaculia bacterium]|nr:VWA domain-containing protein [Thermoanaerobaculia bacterium]